jgi:hypothetical protein
MECVICLENLNYNIITLACSHKYHLNCINSWSKKNNFTCYYPKCPLCDIHVDVINIENMLTNTKIDTNLLDSNNIEYNFEIINNIEYNNLEDDIPLENNTNNIRNNLKNKFKCCIIL